MTLELLCTASGLVPVYDEDYEQKRKLKIGKRYRADIVAPRNYGLHRKYFSLIRCAWDLLTEDQREMYGKMEMFRKDAQMEAGYYDIMYCRELDIKVKIPRSISVEKMRGEEFAELYTDVRNVLLTTHLKHISFEEFDEQLINY